MTAIIKNDAHGMDSGLVVLRDIVSYDKRSVHGQSLGAKVRRPTSESGSMRVVSKRLSDLVED